LLVVLPYCRYYSHIFVLFQTVTATFVEPKTAAWNATRLVNVNASSMLPVSVATPVKAASLD